MEKNANPRNQVVIGLWVGLLFAPPNLVGAKNDLYKKDGVHLSDKGINIFLKDIKQGLMELLGSMGAWPCQWQLLPS